jgi:acid phosphatase type 7
MATDGGRLTLFALGDTGDCAHEGTRLVGAAMRAQPDWQQAWLIEAGDLAYPKATVKRLNDCHEPHLGMFRQRLAVPGNHDIDDGGGEGFRTLFPAVPRSVNLDGLWRVVLLDSNLRGKAAKRQLVWLDEQLRRRRDGCLIAVWHHPRWSAGWHGDDDRQARLWQRLAGVAAITVHGHDHHYEALPPLDTAGLSSEQGTRSFVVGNGGAALYPAIRNRHQSKIVSGRWGFLRLDLSGRHYAWREIGTGGETLDSGEGDCR